MQRSVKLRVICLLGLLSLTLAGAQMACDRAEKPGDATGSTASGTTTGSTTSGTTTGSTGSGENTQCNFDGTWAMKFVIPVTWPATLVLQAGQSDIVIFAKSARIRSGERLTDQLVPCGTTVPDYKSKPAFGGETYGIRFPDTLFDSGSIPPVTVNTTVSGLVPGATYQSEAVAVLLGLTMSNPLSDPWPKALAQIHYVDNDKNEKPGVTVAAAAGTPYSFPPVNVTLTKRANQFHVAIRNVMASTGTIESCTKLQGTVTIPVIANKPAIDSHVLGCQTVEGADCTAAEFQLVDELQPTYTPTNGATVVIEKVEDDTATCAKIRAMTF